MSLRLARVVASRSPRVALRLVVWRYGLRSGESYVLTTCWQQLEKLWDRPLRLLPLISFSLEVIVRRRSSLSYAGIIARMDSVGLRVHPVRSYVMHLWQRLRPVVMTVDAGVASVARSVVPDPAWRGVMDARVVNIRLSPNRGDPGTRCANAVWN